MTYTKKEREVYNQDRQRACDRLSITKNEYNWFRRKGIELRGIYTDYCNGDWQGLEDDYNTERQVIEDCIVRRAIDGLSLYVYFQTDPRGSTIYLDTEPIPENNYTRAVCIY